MDQKSMDFKKQVPLKEKTMYGLFFFGQNIIYSLIISYTMAFYTDNLKLTSVALSLVPLAVKSWDAINDPLFGTFLDFKKSKKGNKYKPWIKIASFALPVATILMFAIPSGISTSLTVVLAVVTYLLWDTMYTVSDTPAFAIAPMMTSNTKERSLLVTITRVSTVIATLYIGLVFPWFWDISPLIAALITGILAFVTMIPLGFVAKERFEVQICEIDEDSKNGKNQLKEMFKYLGKNKYLLFINLALFFQGVFRFPLTFHLYNVNFQDFGGNASMQLYITLAAALPTIAVFILVPYILKKMNKITLFKIGTIGMVISFVIQFIAGYHNLYVFLVVQFFKAFFEGIVMVLMFSFSADIVEYGHFETGIRKEGITFSIQTFVSKIHAAIAAALGGLVLTIIGYSKEFALISDETSPINSFSKGLQDNLWLYYNISTVIGFLLSLIFIAKYRLKDDDIQWMIKANSGEITKEEAINKIKELEV